MGNSTVRAGILKKLEKIIVNYKKTIDKSSDGNYTNLVCV